MGSDVLLGVNRRRSSALSTADNTCESAKMDFGETRKMEFHKVECHMLTS